MTAGGRVSALPFCTTRVIIYSTHCVRVPCLLSLNELVIAPIYLKSFAKRKISKLQEECLISKLFCSLFTKSSNSLVSSQAVLSSTLNNSHQQIHLCKYIFDNAKKRFKFVVGTKKKNCSSKWFNSLVRKYDKIESSLWYPILQVSLYSNSKNCKHSGVQTCMMIYCK